MLVNGTDLTVWALRRDAQGTMPQLIRRLIKATVDRITKREFPAGEGVSLGGLDGVLIVERGNEFVPDGTSVWEMGTNRDVKGKADSDYEKRCQDSEGFDPSNTTFIFVTPRRWGGKNDWIKNRQKEGIWKEVRAFDADDLETWLELAPAVHVWLSIYLGKHPDNVMDLESFWTDWSEMTRPSMTADFILSGRKEVEKAIQDWIIKPRDAIALQAESMEEALAVFAAIVHRLPDEEKEWYLSRTIVVYNKISWNRLAISGDPLILVPMFGDRDILGRALRSNHHVLIPLGRADSTSEKTVQIPRLATEDSLEALVKSGITQDHARALVLLARRSFKSFIRKIAISPEVQQPRWSSPDEAHSLLPIVLFSSWEEKVEGDKEIITRFSQTSYDEVNRILVRWANDTDSPIRHIGDSWLIVSKEDVWMLLARYLSRADLERFEHIAVESLSTPDPKYVLEEEKRWMSNILGYPNKYSQLMLRSIAETLAVMGSRGEITLNMAGISSSDIANRIIRNLLMKANSDWRIWASLSSILSFIAEASPDEFLRAVEQGIDSEQSVILKLFIDQKDVFFSSSPHTGLLWALETLAWSPQHFGYASMLLAKLSRIEPGGKLGNRPFKSLCEIYMPWHPQNAANLEQRLSVIDKIRRNEPDIAWRLMVKLLPGKLGVASRIAIPRWRDWPVDSAQRTTQAEYLKAVHEIVERLITDVGIIGDKWRDLLEAATNLGMETFERIVTQLDKIKTEEELVESEKIKIWDALRSLLSRHRSFPDMDWALPPDKLDYINRIYESLEPENLIIKHRWIFSSSPDLPEGREESWEAREVEIAKKRSIAVNHILQLKGVDGLLELAEIVERPEEIGRTYGRIGSSMDEASLLRRCLASEVTCHDRFARGFLEGCFLRHGQSWSETLYLQIKGELKPLQRAAYFACLPSENSTWELLSKADDETRKQYWSSLHPYWISGNDNIIYALGKFLEYDKPYTALELACHGLHEITIPPTLLVKILEKVIRTSTNLDRQYQSSSYHVSQLFDVLQKSPEISESQLASLEWAYLPLLGQFDRRPKLLHKELAQNPDFFVQIISIVYKAEGEEDREVSEEELLKAKNGHELLDSWRLIPGKNNESIDLSTLMEWVVAARQSSSKVGRAKIGDQCIGQVLSSSPIGEDGVWPHESVRQVVEELPSSEIEKGLEIGLYNSRGVITRSMDDGGYQEHQLAELYLSYSSKISSQWPKTGAMLRRIASNYRAEAQREDQEAEIRLDFY